VHARAHSVALAIAAAVIAGGCGDGVLPQGSVTTGGDATALAFAELVPAAAGGEAVPDVIVASPKRGEVDVLTENGDGNWREVGAFYAGGDAQELAVGHVGGRGAVAVRDQGGSVALLAADTGMPHRLTFPIQVYRRVRNGQPVDDSPPSRAIALADLDGDGTDELLAATPNGVLVIVGLADLLDTNPEHPPPANGFRLDAGAQPNAIAAVDVDGDGRLDLVGLDAAEPTLRVYHHRGAGAGDFDGPRAIALPSPGAQVVGSGCAAQPVRVLLDGGRVVALTRDGKIVPSLNADDPIAALYATRDATAASGKPSSGALELYDACANSSVALGVPPAQAAAMAAGSSSFERLALLGEDQKTVALYRVFTGF